MSNHKAQAFFEKKKEETKSKIKGKDEDVEKKSPDTSKMPEGLRKHFEKKNAKGG
jgi:hypothetical protein